MEDIEFTDDKGNILLSKGLKLKKTCGDDKGRLYVVDRVGKWGAILYWYDDDDVKQFVKVERETLESDYEV